MKHPAPAALRLLPLLAVLLSVGCANPYLQGFTGDADPALPEDAPVAVIGANRADPLAMAEFDDAYAHAQQHHTLLGTSTIVSGGALRDAVAAEAGRELGATLVLYSFAYITSTVEDRHLDLLPPSRRRQQPPLPRRRAHRAHPPLVRVPRLLLPGRGVTQSRRCHRRGFPQSRGRCPRGLNIRARTTICIPRRCHGVRSPWGCVSVPGGSRSAPMTSAALGRPERRSPAAQV